MPGGNQTGSMGQGPRTGRGMGDCAETSRSEDTNAAPERGCMANPWQGVGRGRGRGQGGIGMGFGRGCGRGFGMGRKDAFSEQKEESVE